MSAEIWCLCGRELPVSFKCNTDESCSVIFFDREDNLMGVICHHGLLIKNRKEVTDEGWIVHDQ